MLRGGGMSASACAVEHVCKTTSSLTIPHFFLFTSISLLDTMAQHDELWEVCEHVSLRNMANFARDF